MLAAITEEKATQDTPTGEDTSLSDDPVEDVDIIEALEHLHKQIREMLRWHSAMWDGTLGTINATEHAIVFLAYAVPIRAQPYRTGPFKRQIIADQINKMFKLKIIEPSRSAWASPVVIVPKKHGKARFCVDYRRLCSGACPQSQRGITPSENPAQGADRYARVTTRTPGSLGAKRTRTTEATQTQR